MHVLLVEDDDSIADSLREALTRYGFTVSAVGTGAAALRVTDAQIVLLDLGLPDMDGLDVCRQIRSRSNVPIIVITARTDEVDTVAGLEVGADDYVAKPFGVREVVARMRAVLRRYQLLEPSAETLAETGRGSQDLGRVCIDRPARRVLLDGEELALTPKEFDLLALLAEHPAVVLTREQLINQVWDENWFGSTRTLDVHIASLRRKLGESVEIATVRGVGFRLEA